MTARTAAARYARALFDVTVAERADLQRIQSTLEQFSELLTGSEQLSRVLTNPAVPTSRKRAVVEQLVRRFDTIPGPVAKLLLLLADRDRVALLPDILHSFRNRAMDYQKIVRAEVVTAAPLPPDRLTALQRGLGQATGREVHLDARVDPSIIGGAVARIGSTVYDGSVTTQLEKLKETLGRS